MCFDDVLQIFDSINLWSLKLYQLEQMIKGPKNKFALHWYVMIIAIDNYNGHTTCRYDLAP